MRPRQELMRKAAALNEWAKEANFAMRQAFRHKRAWSRATR